MTSLSQNQQSAITHLLDWKVGALFMEPGTGKTRVAIELVSKLPVVDLVVWVGPLRTIKADEGSVVEEIAKWGGFPCRTVYYGIESISASDRIYLELLAEVENHSHVAIVVDESLKIKNAEAKRTKHLLHLAELSEYRFILNGTPLSRNILDLWSQMEFLSPKILNMQLSQFKNTFCKYTTITKKIGNVKMYSREYITGFANIDYLYSLIRHYIYECDLRLDITQHYRSYYYSMTDEEYEEYDWLKEHFLDDEEMFYRNNNIFLEMTNKMQHVYCTSPEKFEIVDDLFLRIPEEHTIIFCKYVSSREACQKKYPKAKVLSYQSDSYGLNLQEYNHTIYFDKIWDYALRVQSGRRTYRTGQEYDCHYYDLTGRIGLESLIDRNIDKKVSMVDYFKSKTIEQIKEDL